ncbi:MAG: hypothetical protein RMJ56_03430 [Gemmataceae bacterium]|nr:hypothetical protein [Gemmataceae bacterium]
MFRRHALTGIVVVLAVTEGTIPCAWAGPPGHTGRSGGRVYPAPLVVAQPVAIPGPRVFFGFGIGQFGAFDYSGYGTGLYSPSGYGLGFSPFGYSGLPYGGVGYGALGYGFGYPSQAIGVTIPKYRTVPPAAQPRGPQLRPPVEPQYWENTERLQQYAPSPLPLPAPKADSNDAQPATITIIARDGSTVTFNKQPGQQDGRQHTFTTAPIAAGTQIPVEIHIDHPQGASTLTLTVRPGDKISVDFRR